MPGPVAHPRCAPSRQRRSEEKTGPCRRRPGVDLRISNGKRGKTRGVIAGLVPAISIGMAQSSIIGMAGTSLDKPGHDQVGIATTFASLTYVPFRSRCRLQDSNL